MSSTSTLRIVLLEDSDVVRRVILEALVRQGYEVYAYHNPTICPFQAMPECQCTENQVCTDVILTDYDMPEMDGFQFIENLKMKNCKCRHFAIMSGSMGTLETQRADQLGCKIFHKPFELKLLHEWLKSIEQTLSPSRELRNLF